MFSSLTSNWVGCNKRGSWTAGHCWWKVSLCLCTLLVTRRKIKPYFQQRYTGYALCFIICPKEWASRWRKEAFLASSQHLTSIDTDFSSCYKIKQQQQPPLLLIPRQRAANHNEANNIEQGALAWKLCLQLSTMKLEWDVRRCHLEALESLV